MKTGDSALALTLRDPMAWPLTARRFAYAGAAIAVVGLTVWSAVLTKQSRNPMPLVGIETIAVGEPSLPGDRLAGVSEVDEALVEDVLGSDDAATSTTGAAELAPPMPSEPAPAASTLSPELQKLCSDPAVRWFNGRPVKPLKTVTMTVTGYSPDAASCGDSADGITATLHSVETNNFQLVAADPALLPYGSMLTIPGYSSNNIVPVLDCGGAIKGRRLDLLFPTHEAARQWGVKKLKVIVWQYVDGKPADNPRKLR